MSWLLYPNQLFDIKFMPGVKVVYFMKHEKFYKINGHNFSNTKLSYNEICKCKYFEYLKENKIEVVEVEEVNQQKIDNMFDPVDFELDKSDIKIHDSPQFLLSNTDLSEYKGNLDMKYFYKWVRRKLNVLMVANKPLTGQWSYDADNQKKPPDDIKYPLNEIIFPTTHVEAEELLNDFIKTRLDMFGPYQDYIDENPILFHSLLSVPLNNGLITPDHVLKLVLKSWESKSAHDKGILIASYEGFIRQLIGWREYMRYVYRKNIKVENVFESKQKLNKNWYTGIGIDFVDKCIQKAVKVGYVHHIERLMVLGAVMFLSEKDPRDVYNWFMELFLDAYEWVMYGNVYFMSQFCNGNIITKRPYFASSIYYKKMSKISEEDANKWDALYANFVKNKQEILKKYYLMFAHIKKANKISSEFIENGLQKINI
jgi:deoxyribodipyrimidine photolyase-related protein